MPKLPEIMLKNTSEAAALLRWLWGDAEGHAAITHKMPSEKGMPHSWYQWPRDAERIEKLWSNERDEDVWFGASLFHSKVSRAKDYAIPGRVIWSDLDHMDEWTDAQCGAAFALLDELKAARVYSGTGENLHVYIKLAEPLASVAEVEAWNRRLMAALDGDPQATDAARILRLPGTRNHKPGAGVVGIGDLPETDGLTLAELEELLPEHGATGTGGSVVLAGGPGESDIAGLYTWEDYFTPGKVPPGHQNMALRDAAWALINRSVTGTMALPILTTITANFTLGNPLDPWTPRHAADSWEYATKRYAARDTADSGGVLPPPTAPLKVARALEAEFTAEGQHTLRAWHEAWLAYSGTHYREITARDLRSTLYERTEHAVCRVVNQKGEAETRPWNPTRKVLGDLEDALASVLGLASDTEPRTWLDERGTPGGLMAVQNGLLDPRTRTLMGHSPAYFALASLPFEYDPKATAPRWIKFLDSVFPGNDAAKMLLQEWFGYVLSGDTSRQKIMFLKGVTGGGKGVVNRTLKKLAGAENYVPLTFSDFSTQFGMEPVIGKSLAVITDAEPGGKVNTRLVMERLKAASGGDDGVTIDRKNQKSWTGDLPARFMIAANSLPAFEDASGAITERLLMLIFTRSFRENPDLTLEPALAKELPGILNWALDGFDRLENQGRFTEPELSKQKRREYGEEIDGGITAFVGDMCELGNDITGEPFQVLKATLAKAYHDYVDGPDFRDGESEHRAGTAFGKKLTGKYPEIGSARPRDKSTGKPGARVYTGIKLRSPS
jgi:putative DNA primase/helicase